MSLIDANTLGKNGIYDFAIVFAQSDRLSKNWTEIWERHAESGKPSEDPTHFPIILSLNSKYNC